MQAEEKQRVVWVSPEDAQPLDLVAELLESGAFEVEVCTPESLGEVMTVQDTPPPVAALVESSVPSPLRIATQVRSLAPLSHVLFLVEEGGSGKLQDEMSLAPILGTHWTSVPPRLEAVQAELEKAATVSRQRRQLRTTLDTINLHLRSERPTSDSDEYRKLVVSDKYLLTILETAQDAIISLDPPGRVATWNRGAQNLFGYDQDESARLELDNLVAPSSREEFAAAFDQARRGKAVVQQEVSCIRRNGEEFIAEVNCAPVKDDIGDVIAVSLTARDVTERKQIEEELRRVQAELEDRVARRTADLQRVNSELEAFTYSASHDLRAPLRGIDGFSLALMEDYGEDLDEIAHSYIGRIRAGAQRMGEIIDSLLMLSRISQAELHIEDVDLSRIAFDIVDDLGEEESDRRFEVKVAPDLTVRGDSRLLRIVLDNLIGNAWKFTRENQVAHIEIGRVPDAKVPTFYVKDNGAGFDMTYADKLFQPFHRLHDANRFEGSGIGLGTVKRIVNSHGGKVWAVGAPGNGATFYFSLPPGGEKQDSVGIDRST